MRSPLPHIVGLCALLAALPAGLACTDEAAEARAAAAQELADAVAAAGDTPDEAQLLAVADAARAAAEVVARDPAAAEALAVAVGDAQANVLLRGKEGAAWLKTHARPDDPAWRAAARDAALRAGDVAWLGDLMAQDDLAFDRDLPALDQLIRLAKTDRTMDATTVARVTADCAILDARPTLGRKAIDYPVRPTFHRAVEVLGAERVVIGQRALVRSPRGGMRRAWQCATAWIDAEDPTALPDTAPRGMVIGVTDGTTTGWLEADLEREGPWARSSQSPELAARWLLAAAWLEELGGTPAAEQAVLDRYGAGLAGPSDPPVPDGAPRTPAEAAAQGGGGDAHGTDSE